jgi:hypothetical protein
MLLLSAISVGPHIAVFLPEEDLGEYLLRFSLRRYAMAAALCRNQPELNGPAVGAGPSI